MAHFMVEAKSNLDETWGWCGTRDTKWRAEALMDCLIQDLPGRPYRVVPCNCKQCTEESETPPDYPESPPQCGLCGKYNPGRTYTVTMDLDPGNPKVGPEPDIRDVEVCETCYNNSRRIGCITGRIPK